MRVYVDELPKSANECPFYGKSNKKCSISNDKCCLAESNNCEHLITFWVADEEETDGLGD